ncbi:MAG: hypothetical protein ACKVPX_03920 [Myxococcaceae bacterium]
MASSRVQLGALYVAQRAQKALRIVRREIAGALFETFKAPDALRMARQGAALIFPTTQIRISPESVKLAASVHKDHGEGGARVAHALHDLVFMVSPELKMRYQWTSGFFGRFEIESPSPVEVLAIRSRLRQLRVDEFLFEAKPTGGRNLGIFPVLDPLPGDIFFIGH